jgi:hypothetical protein
VNMIPESRSFVETALEGYCDALPGSITDQSGTLLVSVQYYSVTHKCMTTFNVFENLAAKCTHSSVELTTLCHIWAQSDSSWKFLDY